MRQNAATAIRLMLKHEGGFVNHPNDPGGATNRGVTIGTLRRLGMDLDGDGDVDIADLKQLTEADAVKVYKRFYWDKVEGDALPSGVDYAVGDFAVNSGPSRAAKELQAVLGVTQDGDVGPMTLDAARQHDPASVVNALCDRRLAFMKRIKNRKTGALLWTTFGRGWGRRVADVRAVSLEMTSAPAQQSGQIFHAPPPQIIPRPPSLEETETPKLVIPQEVIDLIEETDGHHSKTTMFNSILQQLSGMGIPVAGVLAWLKEIDPIVIAALIGAGVVIYAITTYTKASRREKASRSEMARNAVLRALGE